MPNREIDKRPKLLSVYCRARNTRLEIDVFEISTHSCLLDLRAWRLKQNERIMIKLPGLTWIGATILWVYNGLGGVIFEQPLHVAVLNHLLKNNDRRER